jgi:hypothetical protein
MYRNASGNNITSIDWIKQCNERVFAVQHIRGIVELLQSSQELLAIISSYFLGEVLQRSNKKQRVSSYNNSRSSSIVSSGELQLISSLRTLVVLHKCPSELAQVIHCILKLLWLKVVSLYYTYMDNIIQGVSDCLWSSI